MRPRVVVLGASGQDGPYLAEALWRRGYEVWGCVPSWDPRKHTVAERAPHMKVIEADLSDQYLPVRLLTHVEPMAVYNMAAITFVPQSWDLAELTVDTNGVFVVRMLEAIRSVAPTVRLYQASTSEMFGSSEPPQNEDTPFRPISPYAAAKLLAHSACHVYRESYGVFAVGGILFNHESPWRGPEFVTRHVTTSVARAKLAKVPMRFPIGRTDTIRDWGHAADYVEAMITMMERDEPEDFVIGTGKAHTVSELIELACGIAGVSTEVFEMDVSRMRPAETAPLIADAERARRLLGWEPSRSFEDLIEEMVVADIHRVEEGEL